MSTGRIEAFSDGVFAVAITLLVLDLRVPAHGALDGSLAHALGQEWPSYAAYAVSFLIIGIIWVNHHALMELVARGNRTLAFINIFLLGTVVLIPFATSLLSEYLREGSADARFAAIVYSAVMEGMALGYTAMWLYASRGRRLVIGGFTDEELRDNTRRFVGGCPIYLAAIGVAAIDAVACLVLHALVALFYALSGRGGGLRRPAAADS